MSDEVVLRPTGTAIPRPTVCRMVVVARKDGAPFSVGTRTDYYVVCTPCVVVELRRDEDLAILVHGPLPHERGYEVVPHTSLVAPDAPDHTLVWSWPPRT